MTEEQSPQPPRQLLGLDALQTLEGLLTVGNYEGGVWLTFGPDDKRKETYTSLEKAGLIATIQEDFWGAIKYQLTGKGRLAYEEISRVFEPLGPFFRDLVKTKD